MAHQPERGNTMVARSGATSASRPDPEKTQRPELLSSEEIDLQAVHHDSADQRVFPRYRVAGDDVSVLHQVDQGATDGEPIVFRWRGR